jgi:hypothetical protein
MKTASSQMEPGSKYQSDRILSSDIQIIQHSLYQTEQHVPPICCSRSVEVYQKQQTGNHKQTGWYGGNSSDM